MEKYKELEAALEKWTGCPNVVACSSGTAALHLSLEVLQLPRGSKVITGDFNMIAVPRAIAMAGLEPVFVDCDDKLLINDKGPLGNATVEIYSAALITHVYGRQVDMDWIASTCGACHPVIEDMAELHGVRPHPETDAACWSFYKNKIAAGEEGGAVAFKNPEHARLAKSLRSLGFTDRHDFQHIPRGHNYRMSNSHAALILDSLEKYEENLEDRRMIESWYNDRCPVEWLMPRRLSPWVYDIKIPGLSSLKQDEIVYLLNQVGIKARHGFKPMSVQEEFSSCQVVGSGNALKMSREVFYLPLTPGTTSKAVDKAFMIIYGIIPKP